MNNTINAMIKMFEKEISYWAHKVRRLLNKLFSTDNRDHEGRYQALRKLRKGKRDRRKLFKFFTLQWF